MTDDLDHRQPPATSTSIYDPCHTSGLTSTVRMDDLHCQAGELAGLAVY